MTEERPRVAIRRDDLERAAAEGLITREQADALWGSLEPPPEAGARPASPPAGGWTARDALLALGGAALTGIAAWLLLLAWERFGGAGALFVSVAWGLFLLRASSWAADRSRARASAFLLGLAVAAAPIAVHGAQHWLGLDGAGDAPVRDLSTWALSHGFLPAVAAVLAAALAAWLRPAPLLSAVVVAALWFLAMDGAAVVFGAGPSWSDRALLSSLLGLVALGAGLAADGIRLRDHATWLYLAGLVAFWGGLTTLHLTTGLSLAFGGLVHAGLVFVALVLRRRTFAVFGAVGLAGVLGQAAEETLVDPVVPFALAAIAIALVLGALAYHRVEAPWSRALRLRLPLLVRRFLPPLG